MQETNLCFDDAFEILYLYFFTKRLIVNINDRNLYNVRMLVCLLFLLKFAEFYILCNGESLKCIPKKEIYRIILLRK